MKHLLVPELMREKVDEFMKKHDVNVKTFLFEPEAYAKYNKLISEVLLRGMQAVKEFEEFDRYNDKIAKEVTEE